jgi:hypothetical protein
VCHVVCYEVLYDMWHGVVRMYFGEVCVVVWYVVCGIWCVVV